VRMPVRTVHQRGFSDLREPWNITANAGVFYGATTSCAPACTLRKGWLE
jgi:hypothetical protein